MSAHENAKPMVTDIFVKGAVQGWQIAVTSTIPNVLILKVVESPHESSLEMSFPIKIP